jgi:phosphoribosylamine-glycine ligase
MKILVWSRYGDALSLARLMKEKDNNDVVFYVDLKANKEVGNGIVPKIELEPEWWKNQDFVNQFDLIVCDDENQGEWVEYLENLYFAGKSKTAVFGTNRFGGKLENDREYAFEICQDLGIKTIPYWKFNSLDEGIQFIEKNPSRYVFKPFGQRPRWYTKIGEMKNGEDMIWFMRYLKNIWVGGQEFILQKYIEGVEVGLCAIFSRDHFVKPYECYDDKTEVLTNNGWKYFSQLNENDLVASLENNELKFVKPIGYIKRYYKGKMFNIDTPRFSINVTPGHNIYVAHYDKQYKLEPAEKIKHKVNWIKRKVNWIGEEKEYFILDGYIEKHYHGKGKYYYDIEHPPIIKMDDWLRFFGLWLAEGSTTGVDTVEITNTNVNYVKQILDILPFKYRIDNNIQFKIHNKQLWLYLKQFGKAKNKFIPQEIKQLSARQLNILIESMMFGDGTKIKKGNRLYTTTSKKLADDLQEIIIKAGRLATIYEKEPKIVWFEKEKRYIYGKEKQYLVYEFKEDTDEYCFTNDEIKWIDYEGFVYCVEVPSHIIYVRRNGKSYWCGNCNFEHKKMRGYGQGGNVGEAGTLLTFVNESKLFDELIKPFEKYLKNTKFCGQFDVNTKINEEGIWLMEFTNRIGVPAIYGYNETLRIRWSEFFERCAKGTLQDGFAETGRFIVIVKIDVEPIPDLKEESQYYIPTNIPIFFDFDPIGAEAGFFEGDLKKENNQYYLVGKQGHIGCVVGSGKTVQEAQDMAYRTAEKIYLPVEVVYNPEIGDKFEYVEAFLRRNHII